MFISDIYIGNEKEIHNLETLNARTMVWKYDGGYRFYSKLFNCYIYIEEDIDDPVYARAVLDIIRYGATNEKVIQDFTDELVVTYANPIELLGSIKGIISKTEKRAFKEGIAKNQEDMRKVLGL